MSLIGVSRAKVVIGETNVKGCGQLKTIWDVDIPVFCKYLKRALLSFAASLWIGNCLPSLVDLCNAFSTLNKNLWSMLNSGQRRLSPEQSANLQWMNRTIMRSYTMPILLWTSRWSAISRNGGPYDNRSSAQTPWSTPRKRALPTPSKWGKYGNSMGKSAAFGRSTSMIGGWEKPEGEK